MYQIVKVFLMDGFWEGRSGVYIQQQKKLYHDNILIEV